MVRRTAKDSLRDAACWSCDVMKGGGGFLRLSVVSTRETLQTAPVTFSRTRSAASASGSRGSVPSNLSLCPSKEKRRAVNGGGAAAASCASTVQYSTGLNA